MPRKPKPPKVDGKVKLFEDDISVIELFPKAKLARSRNLEITTDRLAGFRLSKRVLQDDKSTYHLSPLAWTVKKNGVRLNFECTNLNLLQSIAGKFLNIYTPDWRPIKFEQIEDEWKAYQKRKHFDSFGG